MADPRDEELDRLRAELVELKAENARLRGESSSRGPPPQPSGTDSAVSRSTRDKLALFRSRFVGRTDVYPLRWQNASGRSGYAPACHNEWVAGVCGKPAVKCSACPNSAFRSGRTFRAESSAFSFDDYTSQVLNTDRRRPRLLVRRALIFKECAVETATFCTKSTSTPES
jgi:hypothetical protein